METRKPMLETGDLKHLKIFDLVCYIVLTGVALTFCVIKARYLRRVVVHTSKSTEFSHSHKQQQVLILAIGSSIVINGLLRIAATITYMGIQYSGVTPDSDIAEDIGMAPLYLEILAFYVFYCTFSMLIFSWWHVLGGMKRTSAEFSTRKLSMMLALIWLLLFPLIVPALVLMPIRWNSDTMFRAWMILTLLPIALLAIVMAMCVSFLGYRLFKIARYANDQVNKIRLATIAAAFSISLVGRLIGLPFIAATTGTEAINYNVSQILFVVLPDIIPSFLYLYIHARTHYQMSQQCFGQNSQANDNIVQNEQELGEKHQSIPSADNDNCEKQTEQLTIV